MEIVGYNKNYDFTNHLNKATITCTYDELKEIASFIDDILKSANESNPTCCLHLRDFTKDWDKSSSDLIIMDYVSTQAYLNLRPRN